RDTVARPDEGAASSCLLEPAEACFHDLIQTSQLIPEVPPPLGCQPVRTAPVLRLEGTNPTPFFQASDRAVQGAGSQANTGKPVNVVNHGVAMLVAIGQAREHEQRRIRRHYYVRRNIVARNSKDVKTREEWDDSERVQEQDIQDRKSVV